MRIGVDFDKIFVSPPPLIPPSIIELFYKKKNGSLSYRIPGTVEKKLGPYLTHHFLESPLKKI